MTWSSNSVPAAAGRGVHQRRPPGATLAESVAEPIAPTQETQAQHEADVFVPAVKVP
jgi:hypothetical protein